MSQLLELWKHLGRFQEGLWGTLGIVVDSAADQRGSISEGDLSFRSSRLGPVSLGPGHTWCAITLTLRSMKGTIIYIEIQANSTDLADSASRIAHPNITENLLGLSGTPGTHRLEDLKDERGELSGTTKKFLAP